MGLKSNHIHTVTQDGQLVTRDRNVNTIRYIKQYDWHDNIIIESYYDIDGTLFEVVKRSNMSLYSSEYPAMYEIMKYEKCPVRNHFRSFVNGVLSLYRIDYLITGDCITYVYNRLTGKLNTLVKAFGNALVTEKYNIDGVLTCVIEHYRDSRNIKTVKTYAGDGRRIVLIIKYDSRTEFINSIKRYSAITGQPVEFIRYHNGEITQCNERNHDNERVITTYKHYCAIPNKYCRWLRLRGIINELKRTLKLTRTNKIHRKLRRKLKKKVRSIKRKMEMLITHVTVRRSGMNKSVCLTQNWIDDHLISSDVVLRL